MAGAGAEVVVVGAGLAGLCAALEAARGGARVTLLCKRRPGRSGNSVVAAGNLSLPLAGSGETGETFAADTLRAGGGIGDPQLIETLAADGPGALEFLAGLGVPFPNLAGEKGPGLVPGFSHPCTVRPLLGRLPLATAGLALTLPLLRAVEEAGVRLHPWQMAVELPRGENGRVAGVLAADRLGRLQMYPATAVILASGGGGRLFCVSNNTREITGDGLALAYQAGAELRDLEFIQYHPAMGLSPLRMILPTTLFGDGAVLRNSHGEAFLAGSVPGGEPVATRDQMSRAIAAELRAGRDLAGGVELDLSAIPRSLLDSRYRDLWALLRRKGCGPQGRPLVVGLAVHFCMGGVLIDADGRTSVPGLFAAGEVSGGVHGANRLGGNALLEALVFGRRAGRAAAREAQPLAPPEARRDRPAPARATDSAALVLIRRELQEALQQSLGVLREGASLAAGLTRWGELQERFAACDGKAQTLLWWETRQMLCGGRLLLTAAHRRRESRGAHFRSDYPRRDDRAWLGSLVLRRDGTGKGPEVTFLPARQP